MKREGTQMNKESQAGSGEKKKEKDAGKHFGSDNREMHPNCPECEKALKEFPFKSDR
jgi:hypothetical protein